LGDFAKKGGEVRQQQRWARGQGERKKGTEDWPLTREWGVLRKKKKDVHVAGR